MFTLVEPCVTEQLVDRPNLGCAMLVAACRERGLPVSFVAGQPHMLAYLAGLDPDTPIGGGTPLQAYRDLYRAVLGERGPRPHFNGHAVHRLQVMYVSVMRELLGTLRAGDPCPVSVVDDYVERIVATGCDVAGFSVLIDFDPLTREVRRRLREEHGVTIVAGGPVVTRVKPGDYEETLRRESVDYLVPGPGEHILPRLLESLSEGGRPDDVPNVFFMRHGRVAGFEEMLEQRLDSLPFPDFSDVDFDALVSPERIIPVESARGCTWNRCAFCDFTAGPTERYSAFSVGRFVEILRHLRETYACHEFALHDLELPPGRASKLSRAIVAAGLDDLGIIAYGRFVSGYQNPGLWSAMRAAGFTMFEWGLESGCQRTLDAMDKGTTVSTGSEVLRVAAEAGIANLCFVLFGFPGETEAEANETIEFIRANRDHIARTIVNTMAIRADSPVGRDPRRWGVVDYAPDGSFHVESGVAPEKAGAIMTSLRSQESFDPSRFSGERVASIAKVNVSRIVYGMLRSHGLMDPETLAAAVTGGRDGEVFPLVMGEVERDREPPEWRPVAVRETPIVHLRTPPPPRSLAPAELAAFTLADGTRSLAEIGDRSLPGGDAAASRRVAFVLSAVDAGLGLAFERRWEP
jgi:anaerobic magnesium-protoporphyrin IX monomethyl ester cyclase